MNKFFPAILIIFIISGGLSSCKLIRIAKRPFLKSDTTKIAKTPDSLIKKTDSVKVVNITPLKSNKDILIANLQPLLQRNIAFKTFSGKIKMRYDGPSVKVDFVTNIRMVKDSAIWINIMASLFGIQAQVARVVVTQDSFKVINYRDGSVTLLPISKASTLVPAPIDYNILQNFILGNVLVNNARITDVTDANGVWSINAEDTNYLQLIKYTQVDSSLLTSQLRTRANTGPQGIIQFSDYILNAERKFSTRRFVSIQNVGEEYTLDMNFANEEFDQPIEMPFNIPDGYEIINK